MFHWNNFWLFQVGFFVLFFLGPFSFQILWCNHTDDHPQEELMKFGYPSKKKVEKFNESCYCLNMAISEIFFPGNLEILSHFFHKNPMHVSHWIILGSTKWRKFNQKKKKQKRRSTGWFTSKRVDNRIVLHMREPKKTYHQLAYLQISRIRPWPPSCTSLWVRCMEHESDPGTLLKGTPVVGPS